MDGEREREMGERRLDIDREEEKTGALTHRSDIYKKRERRRGERKRGRENKREKEKERERQRHSIAPPGKPCLSCRRQEEKKVRMLQ